MQSPLLVNTAGTKSAAIRTTVAHFMRPAYGIPMDGGDGGAAAGVTAGAGAVTTTTAPPAPAGGDPGQAPGVPATGTADGGQQQPASPLFMPPATPPAPAQQQPGSEQQPNALPAEQPGQPGYQQTTTRPPAERSLDEFPPEIRDYVKQLRTENGDNRVKAKTAEDTATEQQRKWLDGIAKVFGLIEETPAETPVDPAQRAEQLTQQLAQKDADHRDMQVELAIWKTAHTNEANAQRLTNARDFMSTVTGLDPTAEDFTTKLSAAIAAQVEADSYFKADPGPAPAVTPPPVPSGGDFAGGPSGGSSTEPQTVDDFREELKNRRSRT